MVTVITAHSAAISIATLVLLAQQHLTHLVLKELQSHRATTTATLHLETTLAVQRCDALFATCESLAQKQASPTAAKWVTQQFLQ
jgi:hypothetical protein